MAILGYNTKGAGAAALGTGFKNSSKFTLATPQTMTELHGWFGGGSANVILFIYSDVAGVPTTRLAYTSPLALTGVDVDLSQSGFSLSLAAGDYWIGFVSDVAGTGVAYRENSGGTSRTHNAATFNPPATPYESGGAATRKWSMWAVVGAPAAAFVPQIAIT